MKQPSSETGKFRVYIVDDHPLMRHGLAQLINREPDLEVCGEAEDSLKATKGIANASPDLVIMDISLPGSNGLELIKNMKALYKDLLILVLSMHAETIYAQRVLRAGAMGYVMKDETPDILMQAIRRVIKGEIWVSEKVGSQMLHQVVSGSPGCYESPIDRLSDRELEVLQSIGQGRATREIAASLNVSVKTVESHRAHIKEKLDLKNSTELVQFAVQWVENESSLR